jgi:hypothetical protein
MKAKATVTPNTSWPTGVPFFDPARQTRSHDSSRLPRQASVGPIELRIEGGSGPSAIAILE